MQRTTVLNTTAYPFFMFGFFFFSGFLSRLADQ